jgi:hypothetical protein
MRDRIVGGDIPLEVSDDIAAPVREHQTVPYEGICKLSRDLHRQSNIETSE